MIAKNQNFYWQLSMNFQFDLHDSHNLIYFICLTKISFPALLPKTIGWFQWTHNSSCMPYSSLCYCFIFFHSSLYIFSKKKNHHHNSSWYSPTTNIINYLDPGTMPQQNSSVLISTTVLETISASLFRLHLIQIY